ncbi:MAG: cytochrome c-type biogenesis protein CcmH [Gammaproteobacteria bacterium]|nr:cytochrome c-type biogenesis protein CcmH [Gammaproteobacteria bacterium]
MAGHPRSVNCCPRWGRKQGAGRPMTFMQWLLFAMLVGFLSVSAANTVEGLSFPDQETRERYNGLIDELRCPQCLNTNLAGSDAMIAMNLRREVHRMVLEGTSNDEIKQFMFERYGDFILYQPRLMPSTLVLWLAPGLILVMGLWVWIKMGKLTRARADLPSDGNDLSGSCPFAMIPMRVTVGFIVRDWKKSPIWSPVD